MRFLCLLWFLLLSMPFPLLFHRLLTFGRRSDWKKAYVSLKAGQTIDLTGTAKA